MWQKFKLTQVNSNLIFLFPIITSYLHKDTVYCVLSVLIFIASTCYHLALEKKLSNFKIKCSLCLDTCIAYTSYLYMFYFVNKSNGPNALLLYALLVLSIFVYILGERKFTQKYNIHSYFHLVIGCVAGIIPLFV